MVDLNDEDIAPNPQFLKRGARPMVNGKMVHLSRERKRRNQVDSRSSSPRPNKGQVFELTANLEQKTSQAGSVTSPKKMYSLSKPQINEIEFHLLTLFKKILVYSSKIESLQFQLQKQSPRFHPYMLFKEADSENKNFLAMNDVSFFFNSLGLNKSDWEVYSSMAYLSHYQLAGIIEIIIQHNIDTEQLIKKQKGDLPSDPKQPLRKTNTGTFGLKEERSRYYLTFKDFVNFFQPSTARIYSGQIESDIQTPLNQNDIYVIRQITMLFFKKLSEIRKVVRFLKPFGVRALYNFFGQFSERKGEFFGFIILYL